MPDHLSRKEMMNLHDHRFFPAYLLLYGRSIHQYTLQDNHFCSQHSAILSSNTVRRLGKKIKKVKLSRSYWKKKKKKWFIFSPSKMLPILQHQTLPRVSGYQRRGKVSYGSVTSFLFILIMKMVLNTRNCSLFAVALEGASYFHIGHLLAWLAHLMNHLHNCIKYVILKHHKRYKNYIKWD